MRTVYKKSGLDPNVLRKAKKQEAKVMSPLTDSVRNVYSSQNQNHAYVSK